MDETYLLCTNRRDWFATMVWRAYTQLTQEESALRYLKNTMRLCPVCHHQLEWWVAYIFQSMLA